VVRTVVAVATLVGIPLAGYLTGIPFPWIVTAITVGVALLFLRSAVRFYRELHPEFPRHELSLKPLWYGDVRDPYDASREARVVFLPVEFMNREPHRRAILDFDVLWRREDLSLHALSPWHGRNPGLRSPVRVEAHDHVNGEIAFDGSFVLAFEFGDPMEVRVKDRYSAIVRVTDKVTGAAIERPLPEKPR
jgi:hypothetical protein